MQQTKNKFKYVSVITAFILLVIFCYTGSIIALAADVSRAFSSTQVLAPGTVVSQDTNNQNNVVAANEQTANNVLGAVVANDGSLLSIDTSASTVQVAVNGRANVLVSTLNGDIKIGDLIATSSISGVGAKATSTGKVFGIAQHAFNGSDASAYSQNVEQTTGESKPVKIGTIAVVITLGQQATASKNSQNKMGFTELLSKIAGKQVSLPRIILSGLIVSISLVIVTIMIFAAIKNGITATGRNPLAKSAIFESLAQIMALVALICVVSITLSYAVLRL